jgi:hypothetical protein
MHRGICTAQLRLAVPYPRHRCMLSGNGKSSATDVLVLYYVSFEETSAGRDTTTGARELLTAQIIRYIPERE